jgi:UDP-N-acetylglucosamine 2-epimerase (non-hydrolysing)
VFCTALACFYRQIPFGHVEAGLRTWDLQAPWPEEANRVLATRLTAFHFAPTKGAKENLLKEGISPKNIIVTGNTVIDALFLALKMIKKNPPPIPGISEKILENRLVAITGHRRENFGEGFENICKAIAQLANNFKDVQFVYPVHLNPNVREPVERILGKGGKLPNVYLIEPLEYLPFIRLMAASEVILTDSGGIQEEAPSLGKPVLVMRDVTERPEAVKAGTVKLVGTDRKKIVKEMAVLLTDKIAYRKMSKIHNPYGDGNASLRIKNECLNNFKA